MMSGRNLPPKNDAFFGSSTDFFYETLKKSAQPVENCCFG